MALKHFAIYNETTHEYEDPANVGPIDDAETEEVKNIRHGYDDEGKSIEWEETVDEVFLWELRKKALENECIGRGLLNGTWKVYTGYVPFIWEAVTPQEVQNA